MDSDAAPLLGPSEPVMQNMLRRSVSDAADLDEQRINEAILESSRDSVHKRQHTPSAEPEPEPEAKRARYELPVTHMEKLLQAVRRSDKTTFLCNRDVRDDDMPEVVRALLDHRDRSAWHFANNYFTTVGARVLATALATAPLTLSFLDVSNVPIGVDGATAIITGVSGMVNSQLRTLRLANVGMMGGDDAVLLARTLRRCAPRLAISDFSLNHNDFGEQGLIDVARALRHLSNLSTVNVQGCVSKAYVNAYAAEETMRILRSASNARTSCTCANSSLCPAVHIVQSKPSVILRYKDTVKRLFDARSPVACWLKPIPWLGRGYAPGQFMIGFGHLTTARDLISAMIEIRRRINDNQGVVQYMPVFMSKIEIVDVEDFTVRAVEEDAKGTDILQMLAKAGSIAHLKCVSGNESRRRAAIAFVAEHLKIPMDIARILAEGSTSYAACGSFDQGATSSKRADRWELV